MTKEEAIKQAVQEVQNRIAFRLFQEGIKDIDFIFRVCEPTKAVMKDMEKRIRYKHMTYVYGKIKVQSLATVFDTVAIHQVLHGGEDMIG